MAITKNTEFKWNNREKGGSLLSLSEKAYDIRALNNARILEADKSAHGLRHHMH